MLTSSFRGKNFPPGSKVSFSFRDQDITGKVTKLLKNQARVVTKEGSFKVGYLGLTLLESPKAETTLEAVEEFALRMFKKHGLDKEGWSFGFILSSRISAKCNYTKKEITISVMHCLNAPSHIVTNSVLHEIAHALVGPNHNHDRVWQEKARSIGCTGNRCHEFYEKRTESKYIGSCNCSNTWQRERLTKLARTGTCRSCGSRIDWKIRSM